MIQMLLALDTHVTQFINTLIPHNEFFDLFFSFFSIIGSATLIWIAIIIFLIIFEEKRDKFFILYFIIALVTTTFLVNVVIKNIVQRPRPLLPPNFQQSTFNCPTDYSFPSGHAATAFSSATVLAFFDKKRKWLYYLIAVIISVSRIYLDCHYLLDIITGGVIGFTISKLTLSTKKLFNRKSLF